MNTKVLNANLRLLDKRGEMELELLRGQDAAAAEKLEKVGELLKDERFAAEFLAADSAEAAVSLFAGRGVELREEVAALAKQIAAAAQKLIENGGELSQEDLEQSSAKP